jgi:hypothetical protein
VGSSSRTFLVETLLPVPPGRIGRCVLPSPGYRLILTFSNGETRAYDRTPLLAPGIFRELADESYFRQVRAEGGTVVWPNEQDICPDTLYVDSVRAR